jgi:hypothetical protein
MDTSREKEKKKKRTQHTAGLLNIATDGSARDTRLKDGRDLGSSCRRNDVSSEEGKEGGEKGQ